MYLAKCSATLLHEEKKKTYLTTTVCMQAVLYSLELEFNCQDFKQ